MRTPINSVAANYALLLLALIALRSPICLHGATAVQTTVLHYPGSREYTCSIVVAKDATESEKYAATELASHLGRMLHVTFPVLNDRKSGGSVIRLAADPKMGPDTYHLQLNPLTRELLITGGRPRGVLSGVYGLLADHLGCRWYTPDVDFVPTLANLSIPTGLNETVTPRLEYRATDWAEASNPDWAARNRINSGSNLQAKHGGGIVFNPFVHTFAAICDPAKEFATHPEYFSMVDGKRISEQTQLCLSNPEVLKRAIANAKEWINAGGGEGIVSISQNDCENPCQCPECKPIDDAEGCKSASLISFVNKVAEAVEKDYPKATIETLAYLYSRKPPATIKPRHNVIVRLCDIEVCFAHPLDGCTEKTNATFLSDLKAWNKLTDRLYIWDYTVDYNHFLMPFPNLNVLDQNLRTFVANGVKGVFEEGSAPAHEELGELRAWLLAQLMWNPALDDQALQHEFVTHVYGPCAKTVQEFLDLQRDAIAASGEHVTVFAEPKDKKYLNDAVLHQCDAKLEEAAQLAVKSGNTALIKRITLLRMPIWYTRYILNREGPDVYRNQARHLYETGKEFGYTHVDAWSAGWPKFEKKLEEYSSPFHISPGSKLEATVFENPDPNLPFTKNVFFRTDTNPFGVWDTHFDDRQGTMEAWVWCGVPSPEHCNGPGVVFEIRSLQPESGHRVGIDLDREKGTYLPYYETWVGENKSRVTGEPMKAGAWHHLSALWNATTQKPEIGLLADRKWAGKAPYQPSSCSNAAFFIGGSDFSLPGERKVSFGPIDEVRLSKIMRPLVLQTAPYPTDGNTLLLLHFDEPTGTPVKDASGAKR